MPGDGRGWRRWASCTRPFPCQSPATTCPLVITILSWSLDLGSCSITFCFRMAQMARHQPSWVPAVHVMSAGEIFSSFSNLTSTWFFTNFLNSELIVELFIWNNTIKYQFIHYFESFLYKQNAVGRLLVHGPVSLVRPIVQPTLTCRPLRRVGQYSRHRLELVLDDPRPNW